MRPCGALGINFIKTADKLMVALQGAARANFFSSEGMDVSIQT